MCEVTKCGDCGIVTATRDEDGDVFCRDCIKLQQQQHRDNWCELREDEYEVVDIEEAAGDVLDYGIMERGNPESIICLYRWEDAYDYAKMFFNPTYIKFIA